METFHEVLPDNLVFFHFHYIGTKEIKPMDYTIVLYVKNCISEENYTSGVQTLPQTFRDQAVLYKWLFRIGFAGFAVHSANPANPANPN